MREIEFKDKVYAHTQYAVDAIAWATNRRGHNRWESDDVTDTIVDYLKKNNVELVTKSFNGKDDVIVNRSAIRRAMLRLAEAKLARVKNSDNARHIIEFEFAPDVILTGHGVNRTGEAAKMADEAAKPVKLDIELPMPETPFQRYRHDEIDRLLLEHNQRDPDGHADYIDRLIETLKVVLYG